MWMRRVVLGLMLEWEMKYSCSVVEESVSWGYMAEKWEREVSYRPGSEVYCPERSGNMAPWFASPEHVGFENLCS